MTRFVWFWTFWHWSKDSFREGSLLRGPIPGIGGHWDEWHRHEASHSEREAIEAIGKSEKDQRKFIAWLIRHWAVEEGFGRNRSLIRFALHQLANVPPFKQWRAFEKYRHGYASGGVAAIVLAENSLGESEDVRAVETVALPSDHTGQHLVTEGFRAESAEMEIPRRAAASALSGRGLVHFVVLWALAGRRSYPRWFSSILSFAWLAVAGLIIYLWAGPDPGTHLRLFLGALTGLWAGLVLVAAVTVGLESVRAWRVGRRLGDQLANSQFRIRMNGGFTLKGASAGLPFCLNILTAVHRSSARSSRRSWLWQSFFANASPREAWAATGVIAANGALNSVVIEPKLRACLNHPSVKHILTPRQPGANRRALGFLSAARHGRPQRGVEPEPSMAGSNLAFAAEESRLRLHPCRNLAQAMLTLGGLTSRWQAGANVVALASSILMIGALPDVRAILSPPPAPTAVGPSSPSPDYLWVSLDTKNPECFRVVLESGFWANRRVDVLAHSGVNASVRAEIRLQRLDDPVERSGDDAVVWLERRPRFLSRDFNSGERVGRYSVSYLRGLGYE
jgi:hypothetical protein